jgi:adenylate cyclase, class 2
MNGFEVEQKFRFAGIDQQRASQQFLEKAGALRKMPEHHRDLYYQHPARDLAISGEAFRMRWVDDQVFVTYKGPKDPGVIKTRQEIEIPLAVGTENSWQDLLASLGFRPVQEVKKIRVPYQIDSGAWGTLVPGLPFLPALVVFDEVESLGYFCEIEVLLADRQHLSIAHKSIEQIAAAMNLTVHEPRSYLRQIMERSRD